VRLRVVDRREDSAGVDPHATAGGVRAVGGGRVVAAGEAVALGLVAGRKILFVGDEEGVLIDELPVGAGDACTAP